MSGQDLEGDTSDCASEVDEGTDSDECFSTTLADSWPDEMWVDDHRDGTATHGQDGEHAAHYPSVPLGLKAKEFRLFTLLPGTFDSPICGELYIRSLEDCPEYEALSYTWGVSGKGLVIFANGFKMSVTDNLRQPCIDSATGMQNELYGSMLRASIDSLTRNAVTRSASWAKYIGVLHGWWQRAWVVQEFVFATSEPRGCFGAYTLGWPTLRRLVAGLSAESSGLVTEFVKALERFDRLKALYVDGSATFDEVIKLTDGTQATDPRDKVYSLVGVLGAPHAGLPDFEQRRKLVELLRPDYSLSADDVFTTATYAWMLYQPPEKVLRRVQVMSRRGDKLAKGNVRDIERSGPSWRNIQECPGWALNSCVPALISGQFTAWKPGSENVVLQPLSGQLTFHGTVLDEIADRWPCSSVSDPACQHWHATTPKPQFIDVLSNKLHLHADIACRQSAWSKAVWSNLHLFESALFRRLAESLSCEVGTDVLLQIEVRRAQGSPFSIQIMIELLKRAAVKRRRGLVRPRVSLLQAYRETLGKRHPLYHADDDLLAFGILETVTDFSCSLSSTNDIKHKFEDIVKWHDYLNYATAECDPSDSGYTIVRTTRGDLGLALGCVRSGDIVVNFGSEKDRSAIAILETIETHGGDPRYLFKGYCYMPRRVYRFAGNTTSFTLA